MNCGSALDCKNQAKSIDTTNPPNGVSWTKVAWDICLPIIKAKFEQNDTLAKLLLNTGSRVIVESSYDKLWGTGIPLRSTNCLNSEYWITPGILGELLMKTRDELSNITSSNDKMDT